MKEFATNAMAMASSQTPAPPAMANLRRPKTETAIAAQTKDLLNRLAPHAMAPGL